MRSVLRWLLITLCVAGCCGDMRAATPQVGDLFPLARLAPERASFDNAIVVFMPSLTYDCAYASMLTQSFYYYFDQGLAFADARKTPAVKIFLVVNDKRDETKSSQNIIGGMKVFYDEAGELFAALGLARPTGRDADATVLLLDAQSRVALVDEHYRAQGEHLKPLENKLKELNGSGLKVAVQPGRKLKVGDPAPDFTVAGKTKLSDLRGQVVLVSFYPAAFSGTLPPPVGLSPVTVQDKSLISCSFQIDGIDLAPIAAREKRLVVSSSTKPLLEKWQQLLGTHNVEYVNDADYAVSLRYGSYNPKGYNNRVSVIIDQRGRIAYLDEAFDFNDESVLNAKIAELLNSKKP